MRLFTLLTPSGLGARAAALAAAVFLAAAPLAAQTARVQVIHNAPDPAAKAVDVYLNGGLLLDDFAFRTASPYIDAPAGAPITIAIAPPNSTGAGDAIATFAYTLAAGEAYQLVASGVLDPSQFAANPDGVPTAFTLLVNDRARTASRNPAVAQANGIHGSPDAPMVDVAVPGAVMLVDDRRYADVTGYRNVPPGLYTVDVLTSDGGTVVASYAADLTGAAGTTLTVLASGFLDPSQNQNGPAFGLLAVFADGTAALLPPARRGAGAGATLAETVLTAPRPNPAGASAAFSLTVAEAQAIEVSVYDVTGRRVAVLFDGALGAGETAALALDVSALPSGVYVVRARGEGFVQARRLTVVR